MGLHVYDAHHAHGRVIIEQGVIHTRTMHEPVIWLKTELHVYFYFFIPSQIITQKSQTTLHIQ